MCLAHLTGWTEQTDQTKSASIYYGARNFADVTDI